MSTFFVVLAFMLVIMAAMAIGVILSNRPIAGSCGGLNKLGLKQGCEVCGGKDEVCGGKDEVCEEENRKRSGSARRRSDESRGADLGYDATKR